MMFLSNWLNEFGNLGMMTVSSEYLSGSEVYIGPGSRINQALSHGGAAVVRLFLDEPHYVLLTGVKDGSILLFDPYYWDGPYEEKDILIGFNPKFFIDALRVIDEEEVFFYMVNPKAPCFI